MSVAQVNKIAWEFRSVLALQNALNLCDSDLLNRYVQDRDEAAFEMLVRRHGPMVLGVCRRILGWQDAEDAFQATFLVLVRRAAAIRTPGSLANWLHGVAHRTALEARGAAQRRQVVEAKAVPRTEGLEDTIAELWPVLEQELSRLKERYRTVVILCDLEGKTRKEVAHQLGWAEGTVASRLARGRSLLAKSLNRRGFSSALIAATLSASSVSATVSADLVASTIAISCLPTLGRDLSKGILSPKVISLSEGVLQSMFLNKVKTACIGLLVLVTTLGTGLLVTKSSATEPATETALGQEPASRNKQDTVPERVAELKKQLVEMQRKLDQIEKDAQGGRGVRNASDSTVANLFKHKVTYEIGFSEFTEGGRLEIKELWGTRPKIEVGGQYLIRGKYVLPRGVRGKLYFYETSSGDWDNSKTSTLDLQMTVADKQEGEFTLVHGMMGEGHFHLVLADEDKYSRMFANVYFGTGDNVWRKP